MSELLLGVNVDHIATLRQARGTNYPDPVYAASVAEHAGADGITVHLREDRRHIQDRDIYVLKETLHTRMNFEMAVTAEMIKIACDVKPTFCCLVPEKREELTTEVTAAVKELAAQNILVSLFIDADIRQIDAAVASGAPYIEIHTGQYAEATSEDVQQEELNRLIEGIEYAHAKGLKVNAGHGLHYFNVKPIAAIPQIIELNIGHAIIARAAIDGLDKAVRDMKRIMLEARGL